MIRANFDPTALTGAKKTEWDALMTRSQNATRDVIVEWEKWRAALAAWKKAPLPPPAVEPVFAPAFDDDLWKDIRDWLLVNVFDKKCAYCETGVTGFPPDSEHFRPKGRVSVVISNGDKKTQVVKIQDEDGNEIEHPGYFWLAYNWKNLLPSCITCNRKRKRDIFPVKNSHRAVSRLKKQEIKKLICKQIRHAQITEIYYLEPEDLDAFEGRLLVNPYFDNPEEHLVFGSDGTVHARSTEGSNSIEILDLFNSDLDRERQLQQYYFLQDYMTAIAKEKGDLVAKKKAADKVVEEYVRVKGQYVLAICDYVHAVFANTQFDLRPSCFLAYRD